MKTDEDQFSDPQHGSNGAGFFHQGPVFAVRFFPLVCLLVLLRLPALVNAQGTFPPSSPFVFATNNGVLSVIRYTGPGGAVVIPSTSYGLLVTAIEDSTFSPFFFHGSLTNVTIPGSITNIGSSVFVSRFPFQSQLQTIEVDPSNPSYSSVDGVLFDKNQGTVLRYPPAKGIYYAIPISVTHIASNSFQGCLGLRGVYFQGDAPQR